MERERDKVKIDSEREGKGDNIKRNTAQMRKAFFLQNFATTL